MNTKNSGLLHKYRAGSLVVERPPEIFQGVDRKVDRHKASCIEGIPLKASKHGDIPLIRTAVPHSKGYSTPPTVAAP